MFYNVPVFLVKSVFCIKFMDSFLLLPSLTQYLGNLHRSSSEKICGQYLLFSWKIAAATIIKRGISIVLFKGK